MGAKPLALQEEEGAVSQGECLWELGKARDSFPPTATRRSTARHTSSSQHIESVSDSSSPEL